MDRIMSVRLIANVQQYRTALATASAQTRNFGREVTGQGKATSQQLERVGRSALIMAGVMGAGLALSAKAAIDWESAFAGVQKTVDGTAEQMSTLEGGLRDMTAELPASHAEIAGVAEAAGQLGVKVGDVESFTRVMIDLGETTNLSAEEAATSLARFANIMGTSMSDVDRMGSTIVELGNNSATTEREITELGTRLAAAGAIAGLSEADVLAFASTLTSVGVEAEAGGTALAKVFTKVRDATLDGGEALDTFAKVAGTTAEEFAQSFRDDPALAIASFIEGLGRMNAAGESTTAVFEDLELTDQRLMRSLLSTAEAGGLLADQIDMAGGAWEENTALQTEAEKRYQTTGAQMEILRNKVTDLGIDLGSSLLPAMNGVIDVAGSMFDAFAGLPGPVKNAATGLAGVTTAGLGVIGIIGTFGPKIREGRDALNAMGAGGEFANRQLGRLGRFALKASAYAAAFVVLGQALSRLTDIGQPENLTAWRNEIELLARTGDGFDFDPVVTALDEIADPSVGENIGATTSRVIGFVGAFAGIEGTAERNENRIREFDRTLADMVSSGDIDLAAVAFDRLKAAADEQGVSLSEVEAAFPGYMTALELAGARNSDAEGPVKGLTDGLSEQEQQAEDLEAAIDELVSGIESMIGVHLSAERATLDVEAGLDDLTETLKENGVTLDANTEKGRANRRAVSDQVGSIFDLVQALQEEGATTDEATFMLNGHVEALKSTMRQAGFTEDQIAGYLETVGLTPANIDSTIRLFGVAEAEQQLNNLARNRYTTIIANTIRTGAGHIGGPIATGGYITGPGQSPLYRAMGGPTGTDTVPAWLSPGEYVVNADAVKAYGVGTMQAINQQRWQPGMGGSTVVVQQSLSYQGAQMTEREFSRAVRDATAQAIRHGIAAA